MFMLLMILGGVLLLLVVTRGGARTHAGALAAAGLLWLLAVGMIVPPGEGRALAWDRESQSEATKVADESIAARPPAAVAETAEAESVAEPQVDVGAGGDLADLSEAESIRELSVAPQEPVERITNVRYLDRDDAPDWLEAKPHREGDVLLVAVHSKLQRDTTESRRALAEAAEEATANYINQYLGSPRAAMFLSYQFSELQRLGLVRAEFDERIQVTDGQMRQSHALLAFNRRFHDELHQKWDRVVTSSRLMQVALGVCGMLMLLGTLFGYFKLDTATRGYYTGRLQFVAGAAILAVIAATVLVGKWIPWM